MDEDDSLYDEIFNQSKKTLVVVSDINYLHENVHSTGPEVSKAIINNEKSKSQNSQLKKQVSSLIMMTLDLSKRNTELKENLKDQAMTSSEEIGLKDQEVKVLRAKLFDVLSSLKEEQPWDLSTKPKACPYTNTGNRQFIRKKISLENINARKVKIESCNSGNRQFVRKRKPVSDLKPKASKLLSLTGKNYSDSYADSCIVECSICGEHLPIRSMRWHTSSLHHMSITKYKEQCGGQLTFVRITCHLCKLCGKEIQLDKDSIANHVRGAHKVSAMQYNQQFMINWRRRAGQAGTGFSTTVVEQGIGESLGPAVKTPEEDQEGDGEEEDGSSEDDDDYSHGSNDDIGGGEDDGDKYGEDLVSSGIGTPSEKDLVVPDDKVDGDEIDDVFRILAGDDDSWEWEDIESKEEVSGD